MNRVLYIQPSEVPPPKDSETNRFFLLSEKLEGDILQPIWFRTPEQVEVVFGPGSYPVYTAGRFRYHWCLTRRFKGLRQRIATFWFFLRKGFQLYRERRYDCIVAYSHMTTGLLAALLKVLTGARLIIEIVTAPNLVYLIERPVPTRKERLMHLYSDLCLHLTLLMADRCHLLFPGQLATYPMLRNRKSSVFHDFVPVSIVERHSEDPTQIYVLLVGSPWYLKGADLLISAFQRLASDFPQVQLKILGYFPDGDRLHSLIGTTPRIEVLPATSHREALRVIAGAAIVVLPSRCEGLPRVLIEAMAAGVPVVASTVGGIPVIVHDGQNGFLFPPEDADALEQHLRLLLKDPILRHRLGDRGHDMAHSELDERVWVNGFADMVEATVGVKQGKQRVQ